MRPAPRAAALGLLAAALLGCGGGDSRPNLLLITLDTTRADRFGFAGYPDAQTPHFDAFAAERAVSFANAISAAPITFPSHSTIMTGTFPVFHGVHDNDGYFLDDGVTTLAEILAPEGFTTGAVLAAYPLDSEVNLDQGFATYDDDYTADWTAAESAARGPFSFGFLERKADRVNLAAGRWLEKHGQERFFLWIHYFDPHQPYNPPPPYDSQFAGNPYDGEIAFLDENFGKLLAMLKERGLLENTVIAVVGDHGEALGEHGEPTHAHFLYDATLRVPLLFAVPGDRFRAGARIAAQVRTADVAPTLLDLLGLPPGPEMQGETLLPLLESPDLERPGETLLETYYNKFHFGWAPLRALRTERFKYVDAPGPELYDLRTDPAELVNLAPGEPRRVAELRQRLYRLAQRLSSPDLGRSAASQVDDETRRKLEALGYLSGGSTASERAAPFPAPEELATLIDPKDKALALRYLNFINEMLRARRFDDVLPVIHNALTLDPESFRLHVHLARALAPLGRWDKALEAAERAQALRPQDGEGFAIAGQIHASRGDYEKAIAPLTRAVELTPQQVRTLHQLAAVYLALGRDEEAISHFEAVLALDGSSWTALADLAGAYSRTGRWPQAREALQRALELNPYSSTLRYRIAIFYRDAGNPEFSRRMLEETLRLAPDHLGAHMELGRLLLAEGDRAAGQPHLERVIELAPESSWGERAGELLAAAPAD